GLTTSKYRAYAAPLPKARPGWPPAAHGRGGDGPTTHRIDTS
ncbi:MAG: hypothetical protein QOI83_4497, partial [Streptomycetaceae bacterium]|nr:hypothetical protein [Streptomycetaceae bacterium]